MALPIHEVVRPAALANQANGRLPDDILVTVPGQQGGPAVRLVAVAARAWRALEAAALAAGHVLKATSGGDSYRSYAAQDSLFRSRYTTTRLAGRPTKSWLGLTWWQRPDMAEAAVPGTSNHGWGLAVDIGEESDGDSGVESISQATVDWLSANAAAYGWSAELQSEPWHWRWWAGDAIPVAVLVFESLAAGGGEMLAFVTKPSGKVCVADGVGRVHHITNGLALTAVQAIWAANGRQWPTTPSVMPDDLVAAGFGAEPAVAPPAAVAVDAGAVAAALVANPAFTSALAEAVAAKLAARLQS